MTDDLGRFGAFQRGDHTSPELAAGLEEAGYGALWVGGSPGGDLAGIEHLLAATSRLVVATGIVNIWKDDAAGIAVAARRLLDRYPGRFLLGLGVGHPEATGERYSHPFQALERYLDDLDGAGVAQGERVLAALGPRVLRLGSERAAGVHPYLVPAEHSRRAREVIGAGVLLAPEHKTVLGDDAQSRALGRAAVARPYLSLTNYVTNLRRLGYSDADLAGEGSDRLLEDLVALGEPEQVAARLRAHLDAGADHVAVHLLVAPGGDLLAGYRRLAPELGLAG